MSCAFVRPGVTRLGRPSDHIERELVVVDEGILDVRAGIIDPKPDPYRCVVYRLPYGYKLNQATPAFDASLKHMSFGVQDKENFLMSVLYTSLLPQPELPLFVYLYGQGGSGKTTFTQIMRALAGDDYTHITSLRALNHDPFEALNLGGPKLSLIVGI